MFVFFLSVYHDKNTYVAYVMFKVLLYTSFINETTEFTVFCPVRKKVNSRVLFFFFFKGLEFVLRSFHSTSAKKKKKHCPWKQMEFLLLWIIPFHLASSDCSTLTLASALFLNE